MTNQQRISNRTRRRKNRKIPNHREQNTPSQKDEEFEEQQSLEQWLRRIAGRPRELLERKFRYQYRQRQLNGTDNSLQEGVNMVRQQFL